MHPYIKRHIPGWAVTLFVMIVCGVFVGLLISSHLLPGKFIALIVVGLLIVCGGILALTWNLEKKSCLSSELC